jgi:hypothetical protein
VVYAACGGRPDHPVKRWGERRDGGDRIRLRPLSRGPSQRRSKRHASRSYQLRSLTFVQPARVHIAVGRRPILEDDAVQTAVRHLLDESDAGLDERTQLQWNIESAGQ